MARSDRLMRLLDALRRLPKPVTATRLAAETEVSPRQLYRDIATLRAKIRRQHPVGPYIVDFYCSSASMVIEVDGQAHDCDERSAFDTSRDDFLQENGFRIVRILAADILRDVDAVAASIGAIVARPLHQPAAGPPPRSGEDQE